MRCSATRALEARPEHYPSSCRPPRNSQVLEGSADACVRGNLKDRHTVIGTRMAPSPSPPDPGRHSHGLRFQGRPRCSLIWALSCCRAMMAGWVRLETMYFRCGRVRCEHRVDALEEATRCDDATLAGAVSVTHDAGQAVTEDRKHVEASAARRSEASTAVAASAYHRGLVCDQATSCARPTQ